MKDQYRTPNGPGTSTTNTEDRGAARQDTSQNRNAGLQKPGERHGTGMTGSPTINVAGDDYKAMKQDTNTGSGARPETPGRFKIDTSAPRDARTMGRAPAGWLK